MQVWNFFLNAFESSLQLIIQSRGYRTDIEAWETRQQIAQAMNQGSVRNDRSMLSMRIFSE